MNQNFTLITRKYTDDEVIALINKGVRTTDLVKKHHIPRSQINRLRRDVRNLPGKFMITDGCSQCGECCKTLIFRATYIGKDWEEKYAAHGCYHLPKVGLVVPCECKHLISSRPEPRERTKYYCDIYDHRPNLCRNDYLKRYGMGSLKPEGCTRTDL